MGLVYSSDGGRVRGCPHCGKPLRDGRCRCRVESATPPGDGILRVRRETSGRRGKTVTTVSGASPVAAAELAKALKKLCGSGGSVSDGVVEVQGDHRAKVIAHLEKAGFTVKNAGG